MSKAGDNLELHLDSNLCQEESVRIYNQAINLRDNDERLEVLLGDFSEGYAAGWKMCVKKCFFDSLDIRQTDKIIEGITRRIWTQGSIFSFSEGDVLYDTPKAYEEWHSALKHIKQSYQILKGKPSQPKKEVDLFKKNCEFNGNLRGNKPKANLERRQAIFNVVPEQWVSKNELSDAINKGTGKGISVDLIDELCSIGAITKRVEVIAERYQGEVEVRISAPNPDRTKLQIIGEKTMTQDDFVLFLITGETR